MSTPHRPPPAATAEAIAFTIVVVFLFGLSAALMLPLSVWAAGAVLFVGVVMAVIGWWIR